MSPVKKCEPGCTCGKHSAETRAKQRAAKLGRKNGPLSPETVAKIAAANTKQIVFDHRLSGAEYSTLHRHMRRLYPKTGRCEWCGQRRHTEFAVAQRGRFTLNWADWLELCVRCHVYYDGRPGGHTMQAASVGVNDRLKGGVKL